MSTSKYRIKTKELQIDPVDESNLWECDWEITYKGDRFHDPAVIGTASFRGDKALGAVPLSVELKPEYQNKRFGTEVFKLMSDFALGFRNIYEVTALTDDENYKCIYALERAGFVLRQKDKHKETYSITKPGTTWLGLYLFIGLIAGLILGFVVGSSLVGLAIGLFIGAMLGAIMDSSAQKERENITGKNKSDKRK